MKTNERVKLLIDNLIKYPKRGVRSISRHMFVFVQHIKAAFLYTSVINSRIKRHNVVNAINKITFYTINPVF